MPDIDNFSGPRMPTKVNQNAILKWKVTGKTADTKIRIVSGPDDSPVVVIADCEEEGSGPVTSPTAGSIAFKLIVEDPGGSCEQKISVPFTDPTAAKPAAVKTVVPKATSGPPPAPTLPRSTPLRPVSSKAVTAEMNVGHGHWPEKKRIKLHFHLMHLGATGKTPAEMKKLVSKRTMKWVRRVYSQANMAPIITGFSGDTNYLALPPANMISINTWKDSDPLMPPKGETKTPAQPSKITVKYKVNQGSEETLDIPLTGCTTFKLLADKIIEMVNRKGGLKAREEPVPRAESFLEPCRDIYLDSDPPGSKVEITALSHDDYCLGKKQGKNLDDLATRDEGALLVPLVIPNFDGTVDNDDSTPGGSPLHRLLLRSIDSQDDRIDILVLPKGQLAGRAFPDYIEFKGEFAPPPRLRRAAYICYEAASATYSGAVLDDDFTSPYTLPHEIDHVLAETAHNEAEGDVMKGTWSLACTKDAHKRIYSGNLLVGSQKFALGKSKDDPAVYRSDQDMGDDLRTRNGSRDGGPVLLQPW